MKTKSRNAIRLGGCPVCVPLTDSTLYFLNIGKIQTACGGGTHTATASETFALQFSALSEGRANSLKEALVKFGVEESMLTTKGYGEAKPRPGNTNSTNDEKFQNRRIEYTAVKC